MFWELWSLASKNLIDTFDTEDEALHGVRDFLAVNHLTVPDSVALSPNYDEGESHEIPLPPALAGAELRARLAETAPAHAADDATRAVHENIRRWLAEEGWAVRDENDPLAGFNITTTLRSGQSVNIFQRYEHLDHITVALNITFTDTGPTSSHNLSTVKRPDILRSIERDALVLGLEFQGLGIAPFQMLYSTVIYFDGLTKHGLIEKILLIHRAVSLARLAIIQHAEAAGISPEEAQEVVRRNNVRTFPAPQAAAG